MILEARGLHKTYRRGGRPVAALAGMDLCVEAGRAHGLVGPNGAGKSTLLRAVLGLVCADRGEIRLFGRPAREAGLLRRTGSLIETPRFYPFMTGAQTLKVLARTSGLPASAIPKALDRVGLGAAADRRAATYSLGMKQRLGVAAALLGDPELLILDEPLNGLDPAGIREMRALIADLAGSGVTVLVSSHVLSEVERVCRDITIIDAGRCVAAGAVSELLSKARVLRIETGAPEEAARLIGRGAAVSGGAVLVPAPREDAPEIIAALVRAGVEIFEARWTGGDLESLFFEATERAP